MRSLAFALILVGLLFTALPVRADLTIEMKVNDTTQFVRVTEHKIATDADTKTMIFRGDKKLFWMVDPAEKSYVELTQEQAQAMGHKVNDAMAQAREAMKNLPPEQKAMMEKMMSGKMAHAATKRTVTPMHQDKTINGFPCSGYRVTGSGPEMEIWATDAKNMKLDPKDLNTLKELAEFLTSSFPGMDRMADLVKDFDKPRPDQVPGMPILSIGKGSDGKETFRSEVVKIDKSSVPASTFELPQGFTKSEGFGDAKDE